MVRCYQLQPTAKIFESEWNVIHAAMILTHCDLVMSNGVKDLGKHWIRYSLLLEVTKPLHEPILTYHRWGPVVFTWDRGCNLAGNTQCINHFLHCLSKLQAKNDYCISLRGQWVTLFYEIYVYIDTQILPHHSQVTPYDDREMGQ